MKTPLMGTQCMTSNLGLGGGLRSLTTLCSPANGPEGLEVLARKGSYSYTLGQRTVLSQGKWSSSTECAALGGMHIQQ